MINQGATARTLLPQEGMRPKHVCTDISWASGVMLPLSDVPHYTTVVTSGRHLRIKRLPRGSDGTIGRAHPARDAAGHAQARLGRTQLIADQGRALRGKHHEIDVGDRNRTAPEKLKTIIRQPYE
jgi:hypothetical protein